jgi:hypothetical protein
MSKQPEVNMKLQVLSNGIGDFFIRCHCCHATSPSVKDRDAIEVYAEAQRNGWGFKRHNGEQCAFCSKPQCQRQAAA